MKYASLNEFLAYVAGRNPGQPEFLQAVAYALPTAWAFDAMRAALIDGQIAWRALGISLALDVIYLAIGAALFAWFVEAGRERGLLLQMGE